MFADMTEVNTQTAEDEDIYPSCCLLLVFLILFIELFCIVFV